MADKRVKRAPARIFTVKIPFLWLTRAGSPIPPQIFTVKIFSPYGRQESKAGLGADFHGENFSFHGCQERGSPILPQIFTVKIPFLWLTRAGSPIPPQIFTVKVSPSHSCQERVSPIPPQIFTVKISLSMAAKRGTFRFRHKFSR